MDSHTTRKELRVSTLLVPVIRSVSISISCRISLKSIKVWKKRTNRKASNIRSCRRMCKGTCSPALLLILFPILPACGRTGVGNRQWKRRNQERIQPKKYSTSNILNIIHHVITLNKKQKPKPSKRSGKNNHQQLQNRREMWGLESAWLSFYKHIVENNGFNSR